MREGNTKEMLSFFRKMRNTRKTGSDRDFETVFHEAAIRVGTVSVGSSEARRVTFCNLDGMNKVCFLHSPGS